MYNVITITVIVIIFIININGIKEQMDEDVKGKGQRKISITEYGGGWGKKYISDTY